MKFIYKTYKFLYIAVGFALQMNGLVTLNDTHMDELYVTGLLEFKNLIIDKGLASNGIRGENLKSNKLTITGFTYVTNLNCSEAALIGTSEIIDCKANEIISNGVLNLENTTVDKIKSIGVFEAKNTTIDTLNFFGDEIILTNCRVKKLIIKNIENSVVTVILKEGTVISDDVTFVNCKGEFKKDNTIEKEFNIKYISDRSE